MPVITLQYDDLEKLTGTDKETFIKRVPMIGADIERIEDEYIDIEFFPDRPDLYSVEGAARAMRGFLDLETGLSEYEVKPYNVSISVSEDILKIRPFLGCAVVRGVKFTFLFHKVPYGPSGRPALGAGEKQEKSIHRSTRPLKCETSFPLHGS